MPVTRSSFLKLAMGAVVAPIAVSRLLASKKKEPVLPDEGPDQVLDGNGNLIYTYSKPWSVSR